MIIRLVKMEIKESELENFRFSFNAVKPKIENTEGCLSVKLCQDIHQSSIFFTISHWEDEISLENYRQSELFINTWKKVKPMFSNKAQAWSLT